MNTITKESFLGTEMCTNQIVITEPNISSRSTLSSNFSDSVGNKQKERKEKQPIGLWEDGNSR